MEIEYGYCHCGCGNKTRIATVTCRPEGRYKGVPLKFLPFHHLKRAESHPGWKGGVRKARVDGYIEIYVPNHPMKTVRKTVFEHILVMEEKIGRFVTREERVHHINGDRSDNRPENLHLCSSHAEHMDLHRQMDAIAAGGESDWRMCNRCHQYDSPDNLRIKGDYVQHPECEKQYRRQLKLRRSQ